MTTYGEFLEIADTLVAQGQRAIPEIETKVRAMTRELTLAEQVAGGLVLKMHATFAALVDDVHEGRGEAMHHLKTLCESFIYFYEAAANDKRHPDPELVRTATARRNQLPHRGRVPKYIKSVSQVAGKRARAGRRKGRARMTRCRVTPLATGARY